MSWPTSRRFPRTLREAFPNDSRHAYAIERVARKRLESACGWAVIVALAVALAFAAAS